MENYVCVIHLFKIKRTIGGLFKKKKQKTTLLKKFHVTVNIDHGKGITNEYK